MRVDILTLFPEMFQGPFTESMLKRARNNKLLDIRITDIRSFTKDKHKKADDRPFGGGPGMVMSPEPIYEALKYLKAGFKGSKKPWPKNTESLVIYLSPQGKTLDQKTIVSLAGYKRIILLCGHYEGVDERVLQWVNQEISIGDYVLTGGELPAMVLVDAVARFVDGVVKERASVECDSFANGLLDYPHYTRPANFKGQKVPEVLLSGNHEKVAAWRRKMALYNTFKKRPDLLKKHSTAGLLKDTTNKIKKK